MKSKLRDNGLSLVMFGLFFLFLIGQSVAGWHEYNEEQLQHHESAITYIQYLGSGHFWGAVFENWESEFLQMAAYVLLTVFLYQRGSAESKDPDEKEPVDEDPRQHQNDAQAPGPVKAGGWRLRLYECSLSLALFLFFLLSFVGHAIGDTIEHNEKARQHGDTTLSVWEFMKTAEFWFQSFQNWQSEFLAVGVLVVLSVYLRQKGSPESKPVHKPHHETGND